ncbi:hypothetical protein RD792_011000 [Penstemon davidsonii]|uniref:Macro domain-containing protein n=1 Tax=Penstemon davidsonii TaxID=160366 RepID=A0ABR0D3C5_9LAMI|nr:hypothetical protein RD792_011000 [Penstemon davidsonii]
MKFPEYLFNFCEGEEKQETKAIVVILMGLPGSGKSTFCDHVMRSSSRPWARICQDTINNGKSGTKLQCLSSATSALKEGKSVLVDRCNINKEQRVDFLKLGGAKVEKHAVVLDFPAKLCISRSVKRTGHEGNLQGGKAAAVVNQMVPKKELPKLAEGFARINFCQDEKDVKESINVYGLLGPLDSLPSGCFGNKNSDTKTQLGIMKFLKKVEPSSNAGSEPTISQKLIPNEISPGKDSGLQGTEKASDLTGVAHKKLEEAAAASDDIPTLAFPSISTADFQFNLEKASDIIVEKVEEFVGKIGKAKLVLVDLSHKSKILSLVKTKAEQKNIDTHKFSTFVGDITRLRSLKGLHCNVIANAANWRLKPGGGGVNAAIFSAAGSELDIATKEKADCLSPGNALVVPLPSSSPLFTREGVTHVIHVLGPNMNPQRPDCLKDDYVHGSELLRKAYTSLFEGFSSIVRSNIEVHYTNDDHKLKREAAYEFDENKKYKGCEQDTQPGLSDFRDVRKIPDEKVSLETTKTWGSWAQALYNIAMHPENHTKVVLETLDDVVVMNDAYPKAKRHILVLARAKGLDSVADVHIEHISLLKSMHDVGLKWAQKFLNEDKSLSFFRLGYHSVPSMRQLHLHVISQDFDSGHLKNKKHWNSFNTPFFIDSVDVIKELDEVGKVTLKNDKFLSMELRCHKCKSAHPNIPRLKAHISSCQASFPTDLLQNSRLVSSEDITYFCE